MSYQLKVIKDNPVGFWHLDETSGTTAIDYSGCQNNGTYVGALTQNILPLVSGGQIGTKITSTSSVNLPVNKNYYGLSAGGGMAKLGSSDNDFSMEIWVFPKISSVSRTTLFADNANGIGLYYEKGSIVFKLQDEELYYSLNYLDKSIHIIGVYGTTAMTLYVDGYPVASKVLENFKFTNTSFSPSVGPTANLSDYFIADAPAIYRYSLNLIQCLDHFKNGSSSINPLHVVKPDGGRLFTLNDEGLETLFKYEYTETKLRKVITEDVYYNSEQNYISFYRTDDAQAKEFIINDILMVPAGIPIASSKLEWRGNNGIVVETSLDGVTYTPCINGDAIAGYKKGSTITPGPLYIKITMTTTDASKYLPKLSLFRIRFYGTKDIPADNYGFKITSTSEYSLGSFNFPVLSRHLTNGLKTSSTAGFKIPVDEAISSIEMFLTPSVLSATTLVSTALNGSYPASNLSWNGGGTISKTNISKIYVNGVDKTAQTNISNLLNVDNMSHIVIVFTSPVSGDISFNSSGPSNLYNCIAIYPTALTEAKALDHFNLYVERPGIKSEDTSLTVTESAPQYYNNDWVVFSTI